MNFWIDFPKISKSALNILLPFHIAYFSETSFLSMCRLIFVPSTFSAIFCVCACTCHPCGRQTACRNRFSAATVCVLRLEFRQRALHTGPSHSPISVREPRAVVCSISTDCLSVCFQLAAIAKLRAKGQILTKVDPNNTVRKQMDGRAMLGVKERVENSNTVSPEGIVASPSWWGTEPVQRRQGLSTAYPPTSSVSVGLNSPGCLAPALSSCSRVLRTGFPVTAVSHELGMELCTV